MDNYDLQVDIGKRIFLKHDQKRLIQKFCLDADEEWIYLHYFNTLCRIHRETGGIEEYIGPAWQECREYSTVMTIYDALCYHKGEIIPQLAHEWCAVGTFIVAGITNTEEYTRKCAKLFDGHLPELKASCEKLGGVMQPPMAGADLTCRFQAIPFLPVLLQFWEGDEEFSPKMLILWDRNTDQFLHFETTFYLQSDLMARLQRAMEVCI